MTQLTTGELNKALATIENGGNRRNLIKGIIREVLVPRKLEIAAIEPDSLPDETDIARVLMFRYTGREMGWLLLTKIEVVD